MVFVMNKLKIQFFFHFVLFGMLSTHLNAKIWKNNFKSKGRILAARACLSKGRRKGTARALAHQLYLELVFSVWQVVNCNETYFKRIWNVYALNWIPEEEVLNLLLSPLMKNLNFYKSMLDLHANHKQLTKQCIEYIDFCFEA